MTTYSNWSSSVIGTTSAASGGSGSAPTTPTDLTVGSGTVNSLVATWTKASADTGSDLQYRVSGSGSAFTLISGVTSPYTISGLAASTTYEVQVRDKNSNGNSNWSSSVTNSTIAPQLPLDLYSNANFGYGLRKLKTGYNGSLIQVRRLSDNATQDIGQNSSGKLDTSSLLSFAGSASAEIAIWYDQSGNSRDLNQTNVGRSGLIVNNGTLVTTNSQTAISFNGVDQIMTSPLNQLTRAMTVVIAIDGSQPTSSSGFHTFVGANPNTGDLGAFYFAPSNNGKGFAITACTTDEASNGIFTPDYTTNTLHVVTAYFDGVNVNVIADGTGNPPATYESTPASYKTPTYLAVGAGWYGSSYSDYCKFTITELIGYPSRSLSEINTLDSNIGASYGFSLPNYSAPAFNYALGTFWGNNTDQESLHIYRSVDAKLFYYQQIDTSSFNSNITVRDPSIYIDPNNKNTWYAAVTGGGSGITPKSYPLLKSTDGGSTWSNYGHIDVSATLNANGTSNAYAPEFFVDTDGSIHIISSLEYTSGNPGSFATYEQHATDSTLQNWSTPVKFTGNLPTNTIDMFIVKIGSTYYGFYKNEDAKYIELATASILTGPWTVQHNGDWAGWGQNIEAPALIQLANGNWRIYFDDYYGGTGLYYSDSADTFQTWTSKQKINEAPSRVLRHGTVVKLP